METKATIRRVDNQNWLVGGRSPVKDTIFSRPHFLIRSAILVFLHPPHEMAMILLQLDFSLPWKVTSVTIAKVLLKDI